MTAPARLPVGASDTAQQFVACLLGSILVDRAELAWVRPPAGVAEGEPLRFDVLPGATSTTVVVRLSWGPDDSIEVDAAIVDGRLSARVVGLHPTTVRDVDRWIDGFNRTMSERGRELDSFHATGDAVTVAMRDVPPHSSQAGGAIPLLAPAGTAPSTVARPGDRSLASERTDARSGRRRFLVAAVLLLLGGGWVVASQLASQGEGETISRSGPTAPAGSSVTSPSAVPGGSVVPSSDAVTAPPATEPPLPPCGESVAGAPTFADVGLDAVRGLTPCGEMPADGYRSCDADLLPCVANTRLWLLVGTGATGIAHSASPPDVVTAEVGPSTANHLVWVLVPPDVDPAGVAVRLTASCGSDSLTGRSPVGPDGLALVSHPLFMYGGCTVAGGAVEFDGGEIPVSGAQFAAAGSFVVGDPELEPMLDPIPDLTLTADRIEPEAGWSDAAVQVLSMFGGAPLPNECLGLALAADVAAAASAIEPCVVAGASWTFAAGESDPSFPAEWTPLAHGGGFVNADGLRDGAYEPVGSGAAAFDDSVFPCGPGHVGVTICASGSGPESGLVGVTVVFGESVGTAAANRSLVVDFGPTGGPTLTLDQMANLWSISSDVGATRSSAVVRDDSITLFVPQEELPVGPLAYVLRTAVEDAVLEQPVTVVAGVITSELVPADDEPPPSDATTDPTTSAPADPETAAEFYERFGESVRSGDLDFLVERLHPAVDEAYPGLCDAFIDGFSDPEFGIELVEEGAVGPWTWVLPDGRSFDIEGATSVTIALTGRGQSGEPVDAHVVVLDGEYHWFTFCA